MTNLIQPIELETQWPAEKGKALLSKLMRFTNIHFSMSDEYRVFEFGLIHETSQLTGAELLDLVGRVAATLETLLA